MGNSSMDDDSETDGDGSSGKAPPSNSRLYSDGEKVLAYHGTRVYEAKVQKAELRKNEWRYFVHYLGWNKVWDEWVGVDRLLKHNEENIMKQQAINKGIDNNTKSGLSTQLKTKSSTDVQAEKEDSKDNVAKGKKRKNDSGAKKDAVSLEKLVRIQTPSMIRKQVVDDKEFVSQQDKGFLGMDTGSSSQINEANKKGSRRVWTKEEEDALLGILEDLVAKGYRDSGTFRPGTLTLLENALCNLCPASGLKANPHIESKIRKLKKQYHIIYDMLNKSGFRWNDVKKCVEVDSEETWKAYIQHHREADGKRGKHFPMYNRLVNIFGLDRVTVKTSQTPAETIEEIICDEVKSTEVGIEEDTYPRTVDEISTNEQTDQSHSSRRKRRRQDETGGSSQINETSKKGSRRVWTKEEEDALLGILEDLVAKGHRNNANFKSGTLTLIENALRNLCPASGLKAIPHVESKIKKLKKQYRIVYDMLNRSGFRWNDVFKCVEVDSEETWKAFVQHHREADGWRGKYFPMFDRLVNIFGIDSATVKTAPNPVEIIEEINCDEDKSTGVGIEEDTYSRSVEQISTNKQGDQSHSSQRDRGRQDDALGVALDKVAATFMEMIQTSNEQMRVLLESLQSKNNKTDEVRLESVQSKDNKIDEVRHELIKMGISIKDRVKALKQLVLDPFNADFFLTLDNEEKFEFVKQLIDESSKK